MCTCGEVGPHIIMRRVTADGAEVLLWDNGAVTGTLGYALAGVPIARPRTPEAIEAARDAGRLLMDDVCLLNADELPAFYRASRVAGGDRAAMWRKSHPEAPPCKLVWTILHTDPRGIPTERVASLPRLKWPGLKVWDFCGGPGSAGGRYALHSQVGGTTDVFEPTGFRFGNMKEVWKHLGSMQ